MKVTHIDHVGIAVADLDAAIAFYEKAYGMRCAHVEVNEEQGVREAMMEVGDSGSFIQLLEPLNPDTTIGRFLDKNGPGIQQMAYRTDDIDKLHGRYLENGGATLMTGHVPDAGRFIYIDMGDGPHIELAELAPRFRAVFAYMKGEAASWNGRDAVRRLPSEL